MFNYFVLLLVCDLKSTRVLLPAFVGILSNITVEMTIDAVNIGSLYCLFIVKKNSIFRSKLTVPDS